MGADALKHYSIYWTRTNTHSSPQSRAMNVMLRLPLTFWSVSRWRLLMISWGSLQLTLTLGKSIGNTLAGHHFHHVQNCVANNTLWVVFVRGIFVTISNDNFQQNLICILLSFMLLVCIMYSKEKSEIMVIPFCSTLLLHKIMHLKITIWREEFSGIPYNYWANSTICKS